MLFSYHRILTSPSNPDDPLNKGKLVKRLQYVKSLLTDNLY